MHINICAILEPVFIQHLQFHFDFFILFNQLNYDCTAYIINDFKNQEMGARLNLFWILCHSHRIRENLHVCTLNSISKAHTVSHILRITSVFVMKCWSLYTVFKLP